jgi:antitoxin component YwqK of YwqJK toxin-antitoxin module
MKHTLLIITALMLIVGCSKPINAEKLIEEDGLKYHPDTKELYSGVAVEYWYENGLKYSETTFKDGKEIDYKAWDSDGNEW